MRTWGLVHCNPIHVMKTGFSLWGNQVFPCESFLTGKILFSLQGWVCSVLIMFSGFYKFFSLTAFLFDSEWENIVNLITKSVLNQYWWWHVKVKKKSKKHFFIQTKQLATIILPILLSKKDDKKGGGVRNSLILTGRSYFSHQ